MFKFAISVLFALSLFVSNASNASILFVDYSGDYTEDKLTSDLLDINFINIGDWDYVWASPVNTEFWDSDGDHLYDNRLLTADFQLNWQEAQDWQLQLLRDLGVEAFFNEETGEYIEAVKYWNTGFTGLSSSIATPDAVTTSDFASGFISSAFNGIGFDFADTFYVREASKRPDAISTQVPEPATLLIFSFALIALSLRARFIK
ncbi:MULTISPECIES: PEP-CTERM sorting domain-containing protein [Thalassotalea]|uniref:PEP-CTERM sorting domain-containing protein n=1 Tax=Thalassotalea castellviae TaxID=3075612 RepID=A0ABU2ZZG0_9GAMM|nr:PEP-CTERM sorting domain-containing protein [Thalassotalea sp. W431]MDT0603312.1 PEP-CTERM sorting domain-containing protein [Thalassotalea sp. W431]